VRCEAAKSAAIFILAEWLFWWLLLKIFLNIAGNCSGPTPNQRPIHLKSSRETHAVILPTKRALGG
jgi:hypothetical protein